MHKIKKSLIAATFLAQFLFINTSFAASFNDVSSTHPFQKAIEYLSEKGAIKGYPDGNFAPDKGLTKAEFFTILFNSKGVNVELNAERANYKDVPQDSWFYETAEKAVKLGLTHKNDVDPHFYPNEAISKAKALETLFKIYDIELSTVENNESIFTDANNTHKWAQIAKTAKKYGIFEVDQNNYFKAFKSINRGEIANYIYKIETYGSKSVFAKSYKDISQTNLDSTIFDNKKFNTLVDIWDRLHTEYLYKENLNDQELIEGAIQGLLDQLEDPYTTYQPPAEAEIFDNSLNGNLEGIGVEINNVDDQTVIVSVLKGSPAEKAGLQAKDVILKINDASIGNKTLIDVVKLIQGKAGTTIKLTVSRSGQTKHFSVTRAILDVPEVEAAINDDKIGYISISTFSYTAANDFADAITFLEKEKAKGVIIDLRNDPGGFLNTAVDMLNYIVPENKSITSIYTGSGESLTYFSKGPGTLSKQPLVILINQGSASASEIMAAAVKENNVGTLVGTTSFGKGTVQDISYYTDGSFFKMTIAKWLTPSGNNINNKGVKPDITVTLKETDKEDTQLLKAIEIIKSKIK